MAENEMLKLGKNMNEVTCEVASFLHGIGISDKYVEKIYAILKDDTIKVITENPYWILTEFPGFRLSKADEIASKLNIKSEESEARIEAGIIRFLKRDIGEGSTCSQKIKVVEGVAEDLELTREYIDEKIKNMVILGKLFMAYSNFEEVIYLPAMYEMEIALSSGLTELSRLDNLKLPYVDINQEIAFAESEMGVELSVEQKDAIIDSLASGVSVITGGPGTGKTTIIRIIANIFIKAGYDIALAAPTGMAAKRITESTGIEASTVHRLLEYHYDNVQKRMIFGRNRSNKIKENVVIVDEASMLGINLANSIVSAMKFGQRLILIGDNNQLPSIEAGNVLGDIIDSETVTVSELKRIYRQDEESQIVNNAHEIILGEYPKFGGDFLEIREMGSDRILKAIASCVKKRKSGEVQVLTPTKRGSLGSLNMNKYLQEAFNPKSEAKPEILYGESIFRLGDRVMQNKNDYSLEYVTVDGEEGTGVFNGEVGKICQVDLEEDTLTVLYDEERYIKYKRSFFDEIELAYAITVHKSQGGEYKVVIIPGANFYAPMLTTRRLIYTAITRAKKEVYIIGQGEYINAMVDNSSSQKRNTGLKELLIKCQGGIEGELKNR